jgi:hypothetical protein
MKATQTNSTGACSGGTIATTAGTTHCQVTCNGTNWIQNIEGSGGGGSTTVTSGPWTPGIQGDSTAGSPTYSVQTGSYEKIVGGGGDTWYKINFYVQWTALGGATGNLQVTGLPAASINTALGYYGGAYSEYGGFTFNTNYNVLGMNLAPNTAIINVVENGGSGVSAIQMPISGVAAAGLLIGQMFYRAS